MRHLTLLVFLVIGCDTHPNPTSEYLSVDATHVVRSTWIAPDHIQSVVIDERHQSVFVVEGFFSSGRTTLKFADTGSPLAQEIELAIDNDRSSLGAMNITTKALFQFGRNLTTRSRYGTDGSGCDLGILEGIANPTVGSCCDIHDACYAGSDPPCSSCSWPPPIGSACDGLESYCDQCNRDVYNCIAECIDGTDHNGNGTYDSCGPSACIASNTCDMYNCGVDPTSPTGFINCPTEDCACVNDPPPGPQEPDCPCGQNPAFDGTVYTCVVAPPCEEGFHLDCETSDHDSSSNSCVPTLVQCSCNYEFWDENGYPLHLITGHIEWECPVGWTCVTGTCTEGRGCSPP